jgi:hypothetical protein
MSWIKIRTNLHEDPRVLHLAERLLVPVPTVIGHLVRLWGYADSHSTDGLLRLMTARGVDNLVAHTGFAAALRECGWLEDTAEGVLLPRFGDHNGQTAKDRAQNALRVARCRSRTIGNGKTVTRRQDAATDAPLPEESRGEEKRKKARARRGGGEGGWL